MRIKEALLTKFSGKNVSDYGKLIRFNHPQRWFFRVLQCLKYMVRITVSRIGPDAYYNCSWREVSVIPTNLDEIQNKLNKSQCCSSDSLKKCSLPSLGSQNADSRLKVSSPGQGLGNSSVEKLTGPRRKVWSSLSACSV